MVPPVATNGQRVVFFDIDGTLVPHRSSGSFLAERLGHQSELDAAEAAYAAGTMSNHEVCVIDAAGWAGRHEHEVTSWLADLPLIAGLQETVDWCRSAALIPYVASLAWTPVGSFLTRTFGFAGYCGPRLELRDGRFTGQVSSTFDEFAKRDFALETCQALGVDPRVCAAVGDSRSDLPLFGSVGFSIALNAGPEARSAATTRIDTDDLTDLVSLLQAWMDESRG